MVRHAVFAAVLMLGGCALRGVSLDQVIKTYGRPEATPADFPVCYGNGCPERVQVALTDAEWAEVAALFRTPPKTGPEERARIAHAIQLIEIAVGEKTGLSADLEGSFPGAFKRQQMDCVDEMANTSTYLMLFEWAGFLRIYRSGRRLETAMQLSRNIWPHMVASIIARDGGAEYIIDMWHDPPGELPYIMPAKEWLSGRPLYRDF